MSIINVSSLAVALYCLFNPGLLELVCAESSKSPKYFRICFGHYIDICLLALLRSFGFATALPTAMKKFKIAASVESLLEQESTTASLLRCKQGDAEQSVYAKAIRMLKSKRLREVGPDGWTYNQTLHLDLLLLVDALDSEEEAKAEAELALTQLEDYAEDSSCTFRSKTIQ